MKKLIVTILASALILFAVSHGLQDMAVQRAREENLQMMQTLLPGSEVFTEESYTGEDSNIVSVRKAENGFVVETLTSGYADNLRMLTGVSAEEKVTGLVVLEAHETLGLGSKALTDLEFLSQFLEGTGSFAIAGNGDGIQVDGITGATVTSKAIVRSVNSAVAYVTGADISSGATTWGG